MYDELEGSYRCGQDRQAGVASCLSSSEDSVSGWRRGL